MTRERLLELLDRFASLRVAVTGDLFLDRWWEIDRALDEPSVETGLTAYQVTGRRQSAGAAGTVLNNLSALGVGTLYAVGFVGDDGEGFELMRLLAQNRVDTRYVTTSPDVFTPTYTKPMFRASSLPETESNRFDIRNRRPTPAALEQAMIRHTFDAAENADALIVLDQLPEEGRGVVTPALRRALAELARQRPDFLIVADSRAFADRFHDVVIKCNDREARELVLGRDGPFSLPELQGCLRELRQRTGRQAVITCGSRGILVETPGGSALVPALPVDGPMDVCGCGDACTAGMVSALCAGATNEEAAQVGNLCAAVTIRKLGTTGAASREELLERFDAAKAVAG